MNAETQSAYISLASNFYATRMQGVELDELNIIGALLRAAPDYRPDYYRRLRNALGWSEVVVYFWLTSAPADFKSGKSIKNAQITRLFLCF